MSVLPDRTEIIEMLRGLALKVASDIEPDWPHATELREDVRNLRQAADLLLEAGETCTEYRVVGERTDGTTWEGTGRPRDLDRYLRDEVRSLSERNRNVRLQKRTVSTTVSTTPWVDIEAGGEGE